MKDISACCLGLGLAVTGAFLALKGYNVWMIWLGVVFCAFRFVD